MKAKNLQPGDTIVARYDASAQTSQPAGHRVGDQVRTGRFVPVKEQTVQTVTVVGDTAHLVFARKAGLDRSVQGSARVSADTVFEIVRNGEVL